MNEHARAGAKHFAHVEKATARSVMNAIEKAVAKAVRQVNTHTTVASRAVQNAYRTIGVKMYHEYQLLYSKSFC